MHTAQLFSEVFFQIMDENFHYLIESFTVSVEAIMNCRMQIDYQYKPVNQPVRKGHITINHDSMFSEKMLRSMFREGIIKAEYDYKKELRGTDLVGDIFRERSKDFTTQEYVDACVELVRAFNKEEPSGVGKAKEVVNDGLAAKEVEITCEIQMLGDLVSGFMADDMAADVEEAEAPTKPSIISPLEDGTPATMTPFSFTNTVKSVKDGPWDDPDTWDAGYVPDMSKEKIEICHRIELPEVFTLNGIGWCREDVVDLAEKESNSVRELLEKEQEVMNVVNEIKYVPYCTCEDPQPKAIVGTTIDRYTICEKCRNEIQ